MFRVRFQIMSIALQSMRIFSHGNCCVLFAFLKYFDGIQWLFSDLYSFPHRSDNFALLGPDILLSTLFSNTLNTYSCF
jgi:hypothetical protein